MKAETKAKAPKKRAASTLGAAPGRGRWPWILAALAGMIGAFWVYDQALSGPFLFDDAVYLQPGINSPLYYLVRGLNRPFLYFTLWLNAHFGKDDPFFYHVLNVLFHWASSILIFVILRRLISMAFRDADGTLVNAISAFCAAVFLLHPVQAEAVAYIAGRSDGLCTLLWLGAFAVFLYRGEQAISWGRAAAVVGLFGLAMLTKEQAIAFPALLLLTDYWWNPGFSFEGIRKNWKLYSVMAVGAIAGVAIFLPTILNAPSAGAGLKSFTWYQYFFTQCRALFLYPREFLWPANLTLDWDFPISATILDHGAIVGLVALLALVGAAWYFRRPYPLASYGFLVYLVLMAPTSSILKIQDPVAERRLYGSMIGLLLILAEIAVRFCLSKRVTLKTFATAGLVIVLVLAGVARARASLWSDEIALWRDTVSKSPNKYRLHFHLAMAYYDMQRPDLAIPEFEACARIQPPDYNLLVDWGLSYDALGRFDEALARLKQAAALDRTAHVYTQIAKVYATHSQPSEALDALNTAQNIDGSNPTIYLYRGNVYFNTGQYSAAAEQYEHCLKLRSDSGPSDAVQERVFQEAFQNLQKARQQTRGR